jgi:tetratricopeptide (TPR) repeat protein
VTATTRAAYVAALLLVLAASAARAQEAAPLTAEDRRAAVARIAELLEARYVFEDVGVAAGRHVQGQLEAGAYDALADAQAFAERLTADLQGVAHDRHLRVRVRPAPPAGGEREDPDALIAAQLRQIRAENYGFARVERLEGNVGYLDLRGFGPLELVRPTAEAAMRLLAGADAVIVDLRHNGGGSPETVRFLSSYLFGERTHLNSLYWREGDRTEEFWTLDEVPGERLVDVPVFVLTSARTFSAAEEFTYNLRTRERATVVGETTGGGANPGGMAPVSDRLAIFIPEGRAVNPVTGTNWEGVGVEPHVAVPAEEALAAALPLARAAAERRREAALAAEAAGRAALREALARAEALADEGRAAEAAAAVGAALRAALDAGVTTEQGVNALGYRYLQGGQVGLAIAVFAANVAAFPESFNTYDSLGEAYMEAGQRDLAVRHYERSLELNPGNENGRRMLARLRGE